MRVRHCPDGLRRSGCDGFDVIEGRLVEVHRASRSRFPVAEIAGSNPEVPLRIFRQSKTVWEGNAISPAITMKIIIHHLADCSFPRRQVVTRDPDVSGMIFDNGENSPSVSRL